MTHAQRTRYFKHFWPAACAANGWSARDEGRRKQVTSDCMAAIGAGDINSTSALGEDEVTALFCYLEHLANPDSLDLSARWVSCQEDYRTYNRARQADWHERKLYGRKPNKLDRDRFGGEASASGGPLDTLNPDEVRKRHITMASRHQKKLRAEGKPMTQPAPAASPRVCRAPTPPVPVPVGADEDWPF